MREGSKGVSRDCAEFSARAKAQESLFIRFCIMIEIEHKLHRLRDALSSFP